MPRIGLIFEIWITVLSLKKERTFIWVTVRGYLFPKPPTELQAPKNFLQAYENILDCLLRFLSTHNRTPKAETIHLHSIRMYNIRKKCQHSYKTSSQNQYRLVTSHKRIQGFGNRGKGHTPLPASWILHLSCIFNLSGCSCSCPLWKRGFIFISALLAYFYQVFP